LHQTGCYDARDINWLCHDPHRWDDTGPGAFSVIAPSNPNASPPGSWSFTYVFFSNGTPFDAPNRSDTSPHA
jgi:hypothetical protein